MSKRIGIWIRVSTEDQVTGESPKHHEERAIAYAKAKDWDVVEVYQLDAISGKSVKDLPIAQKMLEDVKSGYITGLVFSKLARLARNTRELLEFADEFNEHGADLISLQEAIDTSSPAGRLFFTIVAAMAQWEREEISDRVAASVPIRAKMGKSTGGLPPYGYHWVDGKMVPQADEAPVRKLVYELFREHKRKMTVAKILNQRGYRTRKGFEFNFSTIERLLRDPSAKGVRRANYTQSPGPGKKDRIKPEEDWVHVPVPAIVSEELWDECNRILDESRNKHGLRKRKGRKPIHLFSGYVFCGRCGDNRKLYPQTGWTKYRCYKCTNKIAKDDLEAIFVEQLKGFLLGQKEVKDFIDKTGEAIIERENLLDAAQRKMLENRKKMDGMIELYHGGGFSVKEFKKQFKPMELAQEQLQDEILNLKDGIKALQRDSVSQENMFEDGRTLVEEWPEMNFDQKRDVVDNLVDRITVEDDDVEFQLNYLPGQICKNLPQTHLFNYAKGYDAEFKDPNVELSESIKS